MGQRKSGLKGGSIHMQFNFLWQDKTDWPLNTITCDCLIGDSMGKLDCTCTVYDNYMASDVTFNHPYEKFI